MPLIILNGPPQVGKSTLARALKLAGANQVVLNRPFTKFVQDALELNDAEFNAGKDSILQEHGFKAPIRDALIAAADAVELVDPDVWVKRAFDYVSEDMQKRDVWVLDSIGKMSQLKWLQANVKTDIILVQVGRPGVPGGGWLAADTIMYDTVLSDDPRQTESALVWQFADGREDVRRSLRPEDHYDGFWNDGDLASVDAYATRLLNVAKNLK